MRDLFALLPQSKTSLLRDRSAKLITFNFLNKALAEMRAALKSFFIERNLTAFDPHVGESCCQARAYKLLLMSSKLHLLDLEASMVLGHIDAIFERFNSFTEEQLTEICNFKTVSLRNFIHLLEIDFCFSEDIYFLYVAFFLTKFKKNLSPVDSHIDYQFLCENLKISRKFSIKLIRFYQIEISEISCNFIYALAKEINDESIDLLLLSHRVDDNGRKVLPSFLLTKIILKHLQINNSPIIVRVDRFVSNLHLDSIYIYYSYTTGELELQSTEKHINSKNKLCICVHGEIKCIDKLESRQEYLQRFRHVGIITILLANMAKHPQYSGTNLELFRERPYRAFAHTGDYQKDLLNINEFELVSMQNIAPKIGCCEESKHLFFTKHIYCDSISNVSNYAFSKNKEKNEFYSLIKNNRILAEPHG